MTVMPIIAMITREASDDCLGNGQTETPSFHFWIGPATVGLMTLYASQLGLRQKGI